MTHLISDVFLFENDFKNCPLSIEYIFDKSNGILGSTFAEIDVQVWK